jgi:hypothetical protein
MQVFDGIKHRRVSGKGIRVIFQVRRGNESDEWFNMTRMH